MSQPPSRGRVSHERLALETLRSSVADLPNVELFSGQAGGNRFGVDGWKLTLLQRFQYGDLRIETPGATIVVEVESASPTLTALAPLPLSEHCSESRITTDPPLRSPTADDPHRELWRETSLTLIVPAEGSTPCSMPDRSRGRAISTARQTAKRWTIACTLMSGGTFVAWSRSNATSASALERW